MNKIRHLSDSLVRYRGPRITSDDTVIDQTYLTANNGTIKMRIFDEAKEGVLDRVESFLRADQAAGVAAGITFPHIVPALFFAGDQIEFEVKDGLTLGTQWVSRQISSIVVGDDEDTPASNFDTMTLGAEVADAMLAGTRFRMVTQAVSRFNLPIKFNSEPYDYLDRSTATTTVETLVQGATLENKALGTASPILSYATLDGSTAAEQDAYRLWIFPVGTTLKYDVGDRMRLKLGPDIVMSVYGQQVPAVLADWISTDPTETGGGFEATIPETLLGVSSGKILRIETLLEGIAGIADTRSFLVAVGEG